MSQLPNQKSFHQIFKDYLKTVEFLGYIKAGILFFANERCFHAFLVCSSGWQAVPRDLWLFSTYKFVCLCCGGGQDGDKCFHSHHIYMTIAVAFQTLLWGLGFSLLCDLLDLVLLPRLLKYQYVVQLFQWSKHSFSLVLFCIKRSIT